MYKKYRTQQVLKLFSAGRDTCRIREEVQIGEMRRVSAQLWTELGSRRLDTRVGTDEILLQENCSCSVL